MDANAGATTVHATSQDAKTKEEYQQDSVIVPRHYLSGQGPSGALLGSLREEAEPTIIDTQPGQKDLARLRSYLSTGTAFSSVLNDKERLKNTLNKFELVEYKEGDTIAAIGKPGRYLYVLDTGKVEFWAEKYGSKKRIATLRANANSINTVQGRLFGEQSLQYDKPRSATVIATKPTRVWRLKREDFLDTGNRATKMIQIFEKHASGKDADGEKIMTQEDFVSAYLEMDDMSTDGVEALRAIFEIADMNHSGAIDFAAFVSFSDILDRPRPEHEIICKVFDVDRSGWIRRSHFEETLKKRGERKVEGGAIADADAGGDTRTGKTSDDVVRQMSISKINPPNFDVAVVDRFFGPRGAVDKSSRRKLGYSQFLEFYESFKSEVAAQRFHDMADADGCITYEQAIPLVRLLAPTNIKPFMQKNMTQLLASYRDDRIDYGYFVAFSRVIQHLQLFEAIIEREVDLKQRRITKQEFIDAPIVAPLEHGRTSQGTHHRYDHPASVRHPLGCDQHEQ